MFTIENILFVVAVILALAIVFAVGVTHFASGGPFKPLKKIRNRFWGQSPDE